MSRLTLLILAMAALPAVTAPPAAAQQVLARFQVANLVFSPDGDGVEDTTRFDLTLGEDVLSFSLVVFEADSVTPVDTLIAARPQVSGTTRVGWNGRAWDGAPAPDGVYIATVAADDTTASRRVIVDRVGPELVYIELTPNPYAPGAPGARSELSVGFEVIDTSPLISGIPFDEIQYELTRVSNGEVLEPDTTVYFEPPYDGTDGVYTFRWRANPDAVDDGTHRVALSAIDQAGHVSTREHTFVIDVTDPQIKMVTPSAGITVRQAPAELTGWARDLTGIDSLMVRYADARPYNAAVIDRVSADTTFFHAPLADSLGGEGTYGITVRAVDGVRRDAVFRFNVTIDRTAPEPPALDPFDGVWYTDTFRVTGDFPTGAAASGRVRIFRDAVRVDSFAVANNSRIDRTIAVAPGENLIHATFLDAAGNESAPSNTIRVVFDDAAGLVIASPLRPGGAFDVNLAREAVNLRLYIYDMTGDLVAKLEERRRSTSYSLTWDGRNGSGDGVRRGPLVAVAVATMVGGDRETFRELFLFHPETE